MTFKESHYGIIKSKSKEASSGTFGTRICHVLFPKLGPD